MGQTFSSLSLLHFWVREKPLICTLVQLVLHMCSYQQRWWGSKTTEQGPSPSATEKWKWIQITIQHYYSAFHIPFQYMVQLFPPYRLQNELFCPTTLVHHLRREGRGGWVSGITLDNCSFNQHVMDIHRHWYISGICQWEYTSWHRRIF